MPVARRSLPCDHHAPPPTESPAGPPSNAWQRWLLPAVLTALGYFVAGELALQLAIPPGYASPLYPSAGLALAAVLEIGRASCRERVSVLV